MPPALSPRASVPTARGGQALGGSQPSFHGLAHSADANFCNYYLEASGKRAILGLRGCPKESTKWPYRPEGCKG